jgi:hypothetical protein
MAVSPRNVLECWAAMRRNCGRAELFHKSGMGVGFWRLDFGNYGTPPLAVVEWAGAIREMGPSGRGRVRHTLPVSNRCPNR